MLGLALFGFGMVFDELLQQDRQAIDFLFKFDQLLADVCDPVVGIDVRGRVQLAAYMDHRAVVTTLMGVMMRMVGLLAIGAVASRCPRLLHICSSQFLCPAAPGAASALEKT